MLSIQRTLRGLALCAVAVIALGNVALAADRADSALHGTWKVDVEKALAALKESEDYKKAPAEEQKFMESFMTGIFGAMTITFTETELLTKLEENQQAHEWKVTARDGNRWTLETKEKGKPDAKTDTGALEWVDDDHIVLVEKKEGKEEKLHLVRQK